MARLTPLEFDEASDLLRRYGFGLRRLHALEAGSVNSNFLIETAEDVPLFARIYEEQGPSGATFEIEVGEALHRAGIAVARPLRALSGEAHLKAAGKPFAVYERARGEVLCQSRVTPEVARSVGASLAAVHRADLAGLSVPEGRFGLDQIAERLDAVLSSGRRDLAPGVAEVQALLSSLRQDRRTDLPEGLTHGDLFRDNVLVERVGDAARVAALLDFESACRAPYVYDLMVTVLAWCFGDELDAQLTRALVSGYQGVRPLSALEQGQMVLEGSVACARFAATRLTDFSLRVPPGEVPGRDYRRFLQRRDALVGGALDRALVGVF